MTETAADTKVLCQQLQRIWHEQIPLSKAMHMQITDFDGDLLTTQASLEPQRQRTRHGLRGQPLRHTGAHGVGHDALAATAE